MRESPLDTQQIFHDLTKKFLKPNLAKVNSKPHVERAFDLE